MRCKLHKEFANIYDIFMENVNYDKWYEYLRKYIKTQGKVLDVGCGTGEFLVRFLKDDFKYNFKYDMIKITVKMRIEFNLMKYKNDIRIMFI